MSRSSDRYPLYGSGPTPSIPLQDFRKQDEETQTPSRSLPPHRARADRILSKFSIILAILAGCALTAGTTYALSRDVQQRIAKSRDAFNSGNHQSWRQVARSKVYDPCYFGCNDCDDPSFAYKACAKTAEVKVKGAICDGNVIWNWEDRYPVACLDAVAEIYKKDKFKDVKRHHMSRLVLIILTVLGGVVCGLVAYSVFWCCVNTCRTTTKKWQTSRRNSIWPRENQQDQSAPPPPPTIWEMGPAPPPYTAAPEGGPTPPPQTLKKKSSRGPGWSKLPLAALAALPGKAAAYPCTGYDGVVDQYFVGANGAAFGVVHGWLSNCYEYRCLVPSICTWKDGGPLDFLPGNMGCGLLSNCYQYSCLIDSACTATNARPQDFVGNVLPGVVGCGFELTDRVEGNADLRIANPFIEKDWWVTVRVNGYNLTSSRETDPSIRCLHDISKSNK